MSATSKTHRVDGKILETFYGEYMLHSNGSLDADAVALALKAVLDYLDYEPPLREGFIAYGEIDQSEGRGGRRTIGHFETLAEALSAARGQGVQGDSGAVSWFKDSSKGDPIDFRAAELTGSPLTEVTLFEHRQKPDGSYGMGFRDLREYEFGVRPASLGPVRPFNSNILTGGRPALSEMESTVYPPMDLAWILTVILSEEPGEWIGLWRRAGESAWLGEFTLQDEQGRLPRWMPTAQTLDQVAATRA